MNIRCECDSCKKARKVYEKIRKEYFKKPIKINWDKNDA